MTVHGKYAISEISHLRSKTLRFVFPEHKHTPLSIPPSPVNSFRLLKPCLPKMNSSSKNDLIWMPHYALIE